ncbi:MAG: DUF4269 domain-containing protein [Alphaproteobacteria bacterium]|nr:DUF4269 domain-containing protein [Rhodospirillaceae bacterium]MDG2479615.1 DUF4269 domain-containing protein [Alphaproteobacteria bacterium]MBT6205099.1 DUF4269 domain-containing protein [Rhodospirillaceae bacterium]MBT6510406.1 DUF4269 domain-containing protein [Rhodospirillaceae bacterium]MBT7615522.1 DUF4269 domain-containing protein [Rhodospirillaceae bacterium]
MLDSLGVIHNLACFEPMVIGTPPLEIDVATSDIDVACTAQNLETFRAKVTALCGHHDSYLIGPARHVSSPALRAQFHKSGWEVELFCQSLPITEQNGVRHFSIEQRLLGLEPTMSPEIRRLKNSGLKTEPAFAQVLGLEGDPYDALLALENFSDAQIVALLVSET